MKAIVLPHVWPAMLESAEWYEAEQAGIGARLLQEVYVTIEAIEREPLRFPRIYRDARRGPVARYPFGVFFVIRQGNTYIFSIVHLHRHPKHWRRHLPAKRRELP